MLNSELKTNVSDNPFMSIIDAVKHAFIELAMNLGLFIPKLIVVMIIICIGILLAKVIRTVITKLLQGIKLDALAEKSGMQSAMHKMGLRGSLAITVPKFISYFIIIFMVKQAAVSAGFTDISVFIDKIFAFTPKLITAFIIMVTGMLVGDIIQNAIFNSLDAKGLSYAGTVSNIAFGLTAIIFLTVALNQVEIETELLMDGVKILLFGVALALALALGLGLKEHARNVVAAVYVRDIFSRGTQVEIGDQIYTVKGVGPVTTKLQNEEGEFIIMPNSELVTSRINGRTS